ncbi:MAG: hypothetical protein QOE31_1489 [Solirubrobacteraceae bacterium]|nr:hypothetical protein [Solirubrobacteraceae bacterium]
MSRRLQLVLLGGLLLLSPAPLAAAAPVTVDLRIEGKTRTLYEGAVTTDTRTVDLGDGSGAHVCDGTNNPATPVPGPTRGAAFMTAAQGPGGFTFTGAYSFDMQFSAIAGDDVAYDPGTMEFLAEYKNGAFASFGSCGDQIANGDDVLYAYATGSEQLLALSGPATVAPGASATLRVTDAGSGAPVAGASVGGQTTGADGTAVVTLATAGPASFKATKAKAIRSNAVTICATSGSDGACGTTVPAAVKIGSEVCATNGRDGRCATRDLTAPGATIAGIRDGQRFARGTGPRRLRATIDADPSGLFAVKLRLTKTDRGHVTYFSGKAERFKPSRSLNASGGFWFGVGDRQQVDYLLPGALSRGRYVLDVNAIDRAYNRDDKRRRGANRVVFHVG